ncbi:hypothetical protein GCM10007939_24130 [Amylibacter marinus]|uniref:DUF2948 family protein n=1 Tax=Amylibacter marinus TaxID=1475483 RepID=A0ABQ5VXW2_9RHOB|nr:DUF2948 family protein [Amylibacter marinus]GLQ36129.1 hypothetical protein GCM10007939_24130 [Amylibacter marinus]
MTQDARFEDGSEKPIRLKAQDADDIAVISSLVQDAILPASEIAWLPAENRFGLLLNRFRWENKNQDAERVQTVLVFDSITKAKTDGVDPANKEQILSILSLSFTPTEDGSGWLTLTLAGDGEIALFAECIDITLKDATKPYIAPSKRRPTHKLD